MTVRTKPNAFSLADKLTCCTSHHVELILEYAVIEVAQARIGQEPVILFYQSCATQPMDRILVCADQCGGAG